MGDSGAIPGYHGPLRDLIKVDLPNQRAVQTSSNGWLHAVVVDNSTIALNLMLRLKKTKLGRIHFMPLDQLLPSDPPHNLDIDGVVGAIPHIIRYQEEYSPAIHFIWGDTYLVKNGRAAQEITKLGYRAVTRGGDVYYPDGGFSGGYYRRPPNFKKLIPPEDSIKNMTRTIHDLQNKLKKRMNDLRLSGSNLRKFTSYMDHNREQINRIEIEEKEIKERIDRLEWNLGVIKENIEKNKTNHENEIKLIITLSERRSNTLKEIDKTKNEIKNLKTTKINNVEELDNHRIEIISEIQDITNELNNLNNNKMVHSSFVDRILVLRIKEANKQKNVAKKEINELLKEYNENEKQLNLLSKDILQLEDFLFEIEKDVESTTKVLDQNQKNIREIEKNMDYIDRRKENIEKKINNLNLSYERIKIKIDQKIEELNRIGYNAEIKNYIDPEKVNQNIFIIENEIKKLGAVNQLAVNNYEDYMSNYKQQSVRINELEEEKISILDFIQKIEEEKQENFMKAYNEICENFSSVFSKLTGGGDGRLELQKPEDPFNGGVDLYVQFPGKPMRLIQGGSGGERSIAAIGYLLAIQRFLKAPFYLFDEIDAHLDDVNTGRLADVLRENAQESQFVVISLKDVMVQKADRIYGVFAQQGKSRVIALPMEETRVIKQVG
jgi:chromosome segregation protein